MLKTTLIDTMKLKLKTGKSVPDAAEIAMMLRRRKREEYQCGRAGFSHPPTHQPEVAGVRATTSS
jgi:hypothetical protein